MHIMEKALALKPDGLGAPTRALSTLCQRQTSHALRVVAKHQCNTMWYVAQHRAEPREEDRKYKKESQDLLTCFGSAYLTEDLFTRTVTNFFLITAIMIYELRCPVRAIISLSFKAS